jgi:hypothetical protein
VTTETDSFDDCLARLSTAAAEAVAAWRVLDGETLEPGSPRAAIIGVLHDFVDNLHLVPDEVAEYQRHRATYGSEAHYDLRFSPDPESWAS